jgi:hypothetical protein
MGCAAEQAEIPSAHRRETHTSLFQFTISRWALLEALRYSIGQFARSLRQRDFACSHWRKGWDYLAFGELCDFGFARRDCALTRGSRTPFSSHHGLTSISRRAILAEGVGFAQILLDLTECCAPLVRVIKHCQHESGT